LNGSKNRIETIWLEQAAAHLRAEERLKMTVLVYVNTSKPVGDVHHIVA
jgi:hypothetical protein